MSFKKNKIRKHIPRVSICVITYNQADYIAECLESIIKQEYDFIFEVLVSDDCSTDGTQKILMDFSEKYPNTFKININSRNLGAFKNFITTHNRASGEYVAHIDGDDLMLPGKIKLQAKYLDDHPGCNAVWHRINCFTDSGFFAPGEYIDYEEHFQDGIITFDEALTIGSFAANSSLMYRRNARKTTDPDFQAMDLYYTWELLSSGWGKILPNILGEYRVSATGAVTSNSSRLMRRLNAQYSRYYLEKFPEKRSKIFLFAVTNLLIEIKNLRSTAYCFFILALKSWSPWELISLPKHIRKIRAFRTPILYKIRSGSNFS
jgi:glycosyltransferase involved in cell wall biosynthesis